METPTPHDTSTSCVKLTIVTHLSCSERLAIANLSFLFYFFRTSNVGGLEGGVGGGLGGALSDSPPPPLFSRSRAGMATV